MSRAEPTSGPQQPREHAGNGREDAAADPWVLLPAKPSHPTQYKGIQRLPSRYDAPGRAAFAELVAPALVPGVRVLDVGSGRNPTLSPDRRPPGSEYVGLDVSRMELEKAPPSSYDEIVVGDLTEVREELHERFDLIISWQVLEHVKPLSVAIENMRTYLRDGGLMVSQLSGSYSAFGVLNRAVPASVGVWAMKRLLGRDPESVFDAYYDQCHYDPLMSMLATWSEREVIPLYRGARYFRFSKPLQWMYLKYEAWVFASGRRNLATHYVIRAVR